MFYRFADYELDVKGASLRHAGRTIKLSRRVFAVLTYLLEHQGQVVSKDELAERVWQGAIDNTTIEGCIKKARRAVGDNGRDQRIIATRFGFGYVFVASAVSTEKPSCVITLGETSEPTASDASVIGVAPSSFSPAGRSQPASVTPNSEEGAPGALRPPELPSKPAVSLFIGRQQELSWCAQSLEEASAGTPRVVLVGGEAGIGKTRLLTEVRTLARQRGLRVSYGRCYEDLALPYLPFVRAILADLAQTPAILQPALHMEIEIVRRFLGQSEAAVPTSIGPLLPPGDQDKLRLFLAVTQILICLARHQPTLLVVDDLHWADGPTLDLFSYVVFSIADAMEHGTVPLAILATYRPVVTTERLGRLLARFQGEAICQMLHLPGLNEAEIASLLQELAIRQPSHQLVTTVQSATQGNPLFIQEVVYHLRRQDALQERHGAIVTTSSLTDVRLPAQITGALEVRVRELSSACQHILMLASCLGEYFPFRLLKAVSGLEEAQLLDLMEEGEHHGMVISERQGFQFAHPLLRHVFYRALNTVRRQHLHYQIAQALEQLYAERLDTYLMEITHHLIEAGPLAAPDTMLAYTRRAGDQAFTLFAWHEAARYYEAALTVGTALMTPHERATLHYRAGLAYHRDQDVGPCLDHYDQSITAYHLTDDIHGLAQVLIDKTETQYTLASLPLGVQANLQPLETMLESLGEDEPGLRGRMYTVMSQAYRFGKQAEQARAMAQRALSIGHDLGDDELCARASFALGLAYLPGLQIHAALASWQDSLAAAQRIKHLQYQGLPLARLPLCLILLGRLQEAETIAQEAYTLTSAIRDWGEGVSVALSHLASVSVATGDFPTTERYACETMQAVSRSRYPWGGFRALLALACAHTLRGDWRAATATLDTLVEPGRVFQDAGALLGVFATIFQQLVQAYEAPEQQTLALSVTEVIQKVGTDSYALAPLCALVELADLLAMPSFAIPPYHLLQRLNDQGALFTSGWMFLIPRVLGVAAGLNQWWDTAETHFCTATAAAARSGARPELARTYLDHARMLVSQGTLHDRRRALELITYARPIFHELHMSPFVQRAEQLATACQLS